MDDRVTIPRTNRSAGDRRAAAEDQVASMLADGRTVVVALDRQGFRVPLPPSIVLPAHRTVEVPTDRRTMVELVVGADAMFVVQAWEHAMEHGIAVTTVHGREKPDRALSLTLLDAQPSHGIWLGVLAELGEPVGDDPDVLPVRTAPSRPRTGVLTKNRTALIVGVDERAGRLLGWSPEQLIGERSTRFVHPEDQERAVASWLEMLSTGQTQRVRIRHLCADGAWLWVEVDNEPVEDSTGAFTVRSQLQDISEEMAAHEALAGRERLFRRLSEALPIGLLRIEPDGSIGYANSSTEVLFGRPAAGSTTEQFTLIADEDREDLSAAVAAALGAGADRDLEVTVIRAVTGERRRCAVNLISLSDREGSPGALACLQDVTDSARLRDEMKIRATFDALTGCHNRASIAGALDRSLAASPPAATAVLFLDLDGFKPINDTLGHAAGDEVLVFVAEQLRSVVRTHDLVGRLGGDEFLVVLTDIQGPERAELIADRVRMALNRTVELTGGPVELAVSIGMATSREGETGAALTDRADRAMYEDKLTRSGGRSPLSAPRGN